MINRVTTLFKETFSANQGFTVEQSEDMYKTGLPSFADKLPYAGYHAESQTFILEDLISRAMVFTIEPISTGGKTGERLAEVRDYIADLYEIFEELDEFEGQWVIQEFTYEDNSVDAIIKKMREYAAPHAKGTLFTEAYIKMMERHYRSISKDSGLFFDEMVTSQPWRFKTPRTKLIIYRRQGQKYVNQFRANKHSPTDEITQLAKDLSMKMSQAGIKYSIDDDVAMFSWLFKFFNPKPDLSIFDNKETYYDRMCDIDSDLLVGSDLCEALLSEEPVSDLEDNCWYFNNKPMRFLRFGSLRKSPRIGALTGEVANGEGANLTTYCAFDALPSGSILTKTVVITPQPFFDRKFDKLEAASRGPSKEARRAAANLAIVDDYLSQAPLKLRVTMGVYIAGENLTQLEDNQRKVIATLTNNNVMLYKDKADGLALDAFLVHLPMNFRPLQDKGMYLRSMWAQHSANLFFGFGRGEGTGKPCFSFFNRGGAPVFFDPFHKRDKENNSFGFISGPSGAGKSVTITQLIYSIMAFKRPRLFCIEYGDSFAMAAQDWAAKGLTVNYLKVMQETLPTLAPLANIDRIVDDLGLVDEEIVIQTFDDLDYVDINEEEAEKEKDKVNKQGDTLSELELVLLLMVTGSEEAEYNSYNRADRSLLRRCLVDTAKRQRQKGIEQGLGKALPTVVDDLIDTLREYGSGTNPDINEDLKRTALKMAMSLEAFTVGIAKKLFNTPGDKWPDTDITVINLGLLSQDSNVAYLNVAVLSLLQHINNLGEAYQYDPRDIVTIIDEAHLLLNNEMLGKILTRVIKTARKLANWVQLATQDLADLSGESKKVLNNIEWFYCLNFGLEEAKRVQEIKNLSDEDVYMMASTRKQSGHYTEGVAVSKHHRIQFRIAPPSFMLAVAATESDEKSARREYMVKHGIKNELEAVYALANDMDIQRNITAPPLVFGEFI